jgi:ElaB/YqjD/DUF883 family membrane-anchored ribosome-binding protein
MKNSNGDNYTEKDPMSETEFGSESADEPQSRMAEGARKFSHAAAETWDQTRQKAVVVRERTEFFLRENPVPTVLGALALGLAIGLAIRYSSRPEPEPSVTLKRALREFDWSSIAPAFLPALMKNVKRGYADSAEAVKEKIGRVKDIDVDDYVTPLRKRWNKLFS